MIARALLEGRLIRVSLDFVTVTLDLVQPVEVTDLVTVVFDFAQQLLVAVVETVLVVTDLEHCA